MTFPAPMGLGALDEGDARRAHPVHQHGLPEFDPVGHQAAHGAHHALEDTGFVVAHVLRDGDEVFRRGFHILGVTSLVGGGANLLHVGAQVAVAAAAFPTGAAADGGLYHHPVAHLAGGDLAAHGGHLPGDLVAQDVGRPAVTETAGDYL